MPNFLFRKIDSMTELDTYSQSLPKDQLYTKKLLIVLSKLRASGISTEDIQHLEVLSDSLEHKAADELDQKEQILLKKIHFAVKELGLVEG